MAAGLIPRKRLAWIPKHLRLAHEFCFFLHDEAVRALVEYEGADAHFVTVKFKDQSQADDFQEIAAGDTIEALRSLGFDSEARRIIINTITMALVSDFGHHVYEALRCLEKRKVVVACNLLRKPLTDNLVYLSWMLADEEQFIEAFCKESPASLTPKLIGNKRPEIIASALSKTELAGRLNAKEIYDSIFNHRNSAGLYMLFQHAVHLITVQREEIKTSRENFNFVFKNYGDDDIYECLYSQLPALLLFASHVILELFDRMKTADPGSKEAFYSRSMLGYGLATGSFVPVVDLLRSLEDHVLCSECRSPMVMTRHNAERLVLDESFRCVHCRKVNPFPFSWIL